MSSDAAKVFDPLRRKEVALTPEERVRQWFIGVLRDHLGVPVHLMNSEVEMHFGASGKTYRADILVYDRKGQPLAIVECKRPDVKLTQEVLEQALRYDMVLGVKWFFITNGQQTRVAMRDGDKVTAVGHAPRYGEMTGEAQ